MVVAFYVLIGCAFTLAMLFALRDVMTEQESRFFIPFSIVAWPLLLAILVAFLVAKER